MLKNLIFKLTYWFENKKKSHSLITHFSQYFWQNCFWNTLGNSFCVKLQIKIAMFSFFWLVVVGVVIVFVNCDLWIFTDWERVKSFQPSEHVLLGCFYSIILKKEQMNWGNFYSGRTKINKKYSFSFLVGNEDPVQLWSYVSGFAKAYWDVLCQ